MSGQEARSAATRCPYCGEPNSLHDYASPTTCVLRSKPTSEGGGYVQTRVNEPTAATTEPRVSYDGPIEVGMVMVGLGNEGEPFRRDLVLGFHPFKEGMVIYEALPCKMRKRLGGNVDEIGLCPEVNMRYVMRPEEAS